MIFWVRERRRRSDKLSFQLGVDQQDRKFLSGKRVCEMILKKRITWFHSLFSTRISEWMHENVAEANVYGQTEAKHEG